MPLFRCQRIGRGRAVDGDLFPLRRARLLVVPLIFQILAAGFDLESRRLARLDGHTLRLRRDRRHARHRQHGVARPDLSGIVPDLAAVGVAIVPRRRRQRIGRARPVLGHLRPLRRAGRQIVPLVFQILAAGGHLKGRRLAHRDRYACRLGGDFRLADHRQRDVCALHRADRIVHHTTVGVTVVARRRRQGVGRAGAVHLHFIPAGIAGLLVPPLIADILAAGGHLEGRSLARGDSDAYRLRRD